MVGVRQGFERCNATWRLEVGYVDVRFEAGRNHSARPLRLQGLLDAPADRDDHRVERSILVWGARCRRIAGDSVGLLAPGARWAPSAPVELRGTRTAHREHCRVGGIQRALLAAGECRNGAQAEALTDQALAWIKEAMAEYFTQRTDRETDAATAASGN